MNCKIHVLSDNKSVNGISKEHGLSFLIEREGKTLLLDTGSGRNFLHNAAHLGLSLNNLQALVLSHGHYDHTGGVGELLRRWPQIPLFAHSSLLNQHYSLHGDGKFYNIGVDSAHRDLIRSLPEGQWIKVEEKKEVLPGIFAVSFIGRVEDYSLGTNGFFQDPRGLQADIVPDDLSLLIRQDNGDHLICGCCHSGLKNTIGHLEKHFSSLKLHSLMGGFHLSHAEDEQILELGQWIESLNIKRLICSHCTGDRAFKLWSETLSIPVEQSSAGMTYLL